MSVRSFGDHIDTLRVPLHRIPHGQPDGPWLPSLERMAHVRLRLASDACCHDTLLLEAPERSDSSASETGRHLNEVSIWEACWAYQ